MKKALIITNLVGFVHFLWGDIALLQSKGYKVVFAANSDGAYESDLNRIAELGVEFYDLSLSSKSPFSRESLMAYLEIKRLLKDNAFDVIHCHTPIVGFLTRLAACKARKKGTKVLYTTHGLSFTKYSGLKEKLLYYTIEKIASLLCDAIITINLEDYQAAKGFLCKKVFKINGVGVDTSIYHDVTVNVAEYKKALGLPVDKIMVLSVGELSVRKNHQIIIRALGMLPNKADYIYVICGKEVGGTVVTEQLRGLAEENGVALYLLGHRGDIPEIMHCSDIGAIPSIREGLGLAGVQSLCAQVPLVGTDVQGICEYILDDVTGYLCRPFDAEGYAEAIRKLSDETVRARLKANCYEVAVMFDKRVSGQQMKDIYEEMAI